MLKLLAVLIPAALWLSPAAADAPTPLSSPRGTLTSVAGSVSGSTTSRYNLVVVRGDSVRIKLSSDLIGSCSLGIVQPPSVTPFFQAYGDSSSFTSKEIDDRTLQVVAYPSRDAFINNRPCNFTISYQVD